MRKLLIVAVGLLTVASLVQAAEVETTKGTRQLVFGFSGLSDLGVTTYEGGLAVRHYLNDGVAIKPGLQFNLGSRTTEPEGEEKDKVNDTGFGVNCILEKHLTGATKSISPYLGVGAGLHMNKHKVEPGEDNATVMTTTMFDLGVMGVIGFEWAFADGMSLGAAYTAGVDIGSGKIKAEPANGNSSEDKASEMDLGLGLLGVELSVAW